MFKDYVLKNGILYKYRIVESKHLMWQFGGVPCIDASLWDKNKNKIDKIEFHTDKGRIFNISKDEFEENKRIFDMGFGRQYWAKKEYWTITEKTYEEKLKEFAQNCL